MFFKLLTEKNEMQVRGAAVMADDCGWRRVSNRSTSSDSHRSAISFFTSAGSCETIKSLSSDTSCWDTHGNHTNIQHTLNSRTTRFIVVRSNLRPTSTLGVERLTFNRVQSFNLLRPQSTPSCSILPSPASTSGIYSSSSSIHSSIFDLHRPYLTSALKEKLAWGFRYKVALGTTKGLLYLHEVWQRRIVHRDIKAANILLTQDFEPHICDFWLVKWLPEHRTHHTVSRFEGTF